MTKEDFKILYEKRRTVRKFLSDPVPDSDVEYIIDAARLAPTGMNNQNWRYIAIRNKDLLYKMADTVEESLRSSYYQKIDDEAVIKKIEAFKFYYTFFKDAPLVIACIGWKAGSFLTPIIEKYNLNPSYGEMVDPDILTLGGAIENAILAATVLGYGSAWLTGPVRHQKPLEKLLNIEAPEHLISVIAVGKPAKEIKGPPKKSLDEILSYIN
jgi:nitroreductase